MSTFGMFGESRIVSPKSILAIRACIWKGKAIRKTILSVVLKCFSKLAFYGIQTFGELYKWKWVEFEQENWACWERLFWLKLYFFALFRVRTYCSTSLEKESWFEFDPIWTGLTTFTLYWPGTIIKSITFKSDNLFKTSLNLVLCYNGYSCIESFPFD